MSSDKEKFCEMVNADRFSLEMDADEAKPLGINAACDWPVSRRDFMNGVSATVGASVVVPEYSGYEIQSSGCARNR
jgi:hypothetical protein